MSNLSKILFLVEGHHLWELIWLLFRFILYYMYYICIYMYNVYIYICIIVCAYIFCERHHELWVLSWNLWNILYLSWLSCVSYQVGERGYKNTGCFFSWFTASPSPLNFFDPMQNAVKHTLRPYRDIQGER